MQYSLYTVCLERWAQRLAHLATQQIDLFGYVHNPYEGHSPATVRRLQVLLAQHGQAADWLAGYRGSGQMPLL